MFLLPDFIGATSGLLGRTDEPITDAEIARDRLVREALMRRLANLPADMPEETPRAA